MLKLIGFNTTAGLCATISYPTPTPRTDIEGLCFVEPYDITCNPKEGVASPFSGATDRSTAPFIESIKRGFHQLKLAVGTCCSNFEVDIGTAVVVPLEVIENLLYTYCLPLVSVPKTFTTSYVLPYIFSLQGFG